VNSSLFVRYLVGLSCLCTELLKQFKTKSKSLEFQDQDWVNWVSRHFDLRLRFKCRELQTRNQVYYTSIQSVLSRPNPMKTTHTDHRQLSRRTESPPQPVLWHVHQNHYQPPSVFLCRGLSLCKPTVYKMTLLL